MTTMNDVPEQEELWVEEEDLAPDMPVIKAGYIENKLSKDEKNEVYSLVRQMAKFPLSQRQFFFLVQQIAMIMENQTISRGLLTELGRLAPQLESKELAQVKSSLLANKTPSVSKLIV